MKQVTKRLLVLIFTTLMSISCQTTNPLSGEKTFNTVSESTEKRVGKKAYQDLLKQYGPYNDPELTQYIKTIGKKIDTKLISPRFNYTYTLLNAGMLNAFAAPGGYIFITRGLLLNCNTIDELAGVIGHEITHVAAKHTAQSISKQQVSSIINLGILMATKNKTYSDAAQTLGTAIMKGYGRENELESDKFGLILANQAGYDPRGTVSFMKTLSRNQKKTPQGLAQFFASHPNSELRYEKLNQHLQNLDNPVKSTLTLAQKRTQYLRKIDGMIYGQWPHQGGIIRNKSSKKFYVNPYYNIKIPLNNWTFKTNKESPFLNLSIPFEFVSGKLHMFTPREIKQSSFYKDIKKQATETLSFQNILGRYKIKSDSSKHILQLSFEHQNRYYVLEISGDKKSLKKHALNLLNHIEFKSLEQSKAIGASTLQLYKSKKGDSYESLSEHFYKSKKYANDLATFNGQDAIQRPHKLLKIWIKPAKKESIRNY